MPFDFPEAPSPRDEGLARYKRQQADLFEDHIALRDVDEYWTKVGWPWRPDPDTDSREGFPENAYLSDYTCCECGKDLSCCGGHAI